MNINAGDQFKVLRFTAIAKHIAPSAAYFQLAHVSQSGFTRSGFGHVAVMLGCVEEHDAVLLISVPDDYQQTETVAAIQKRIFEILKLPDDHSFVVYLSPRPIAEMHGPYSPGHFPPISGG